MSGIPQPLQQLLERVARLHPKDVAAILADLPALDRAWVLEHIRALDETSAETPTARSSGNPQEALSSWLLALDRSREGLTERAGTTLNAHIAVLGGARRSGPCYARGFGEVFRSWLGMERRS